MNPSRMLAMARKEWIQLKRDPRSMVLAFALPLLLLIFFGYAITWDVNDIRLAVLDQDNTAESRDLVEALQNGNLVGLCAAVRWREGGSCQHDSRDDPAGRHGA